MCFVFFNNRKSNHRCHLSRSAGFIITISVHITTVISCVFVISQSINVCYNYYGSHKFKGTIRCSWSKNHANPHDIHGILGIFLQCSMWNIKVELGFCVRELCCKNVHTKQV